MSTVSLSSRRPSTNTTPPLRIVAPPPAINPQRQRRVYKNEMCAFLVLRPKLVDEMLAANSLGHMISLTEGIDHDIQDLIPGAVSRELQIGGSLMLHQSGVEVLSVPEVTSFLAGRWQIGAVEDGNQRNLERLVSLRNKPSERENVHPLYQPQLFR